MYGFFVCIGTYFLFFCNVYRVRVSKLNVCKCLQCHINVMMIFCSTRASGTVYTAIDIATGQEVGQILKMMKKYADAVCHFFVLANQTDSSFSGGHQADEPAAAAQERADHQ